MRTETIIKTWYKFDELPKETQEKAIENLWDLNVAHRWWDFIHEDAENIGLKIIEFDLNRGGYCKGKLLYSAKTVAKKILKDHGDTCDTYQLAVVFLASRSSNVNDDDEVIDEEKAEELEVEFERALCKEYLYILRKEYEYLTSREAIIESIYANEYEFDEKGNL